MTTNEMPAEQQPIDPQHERGLSVDEYVGREVHHYLWEKRKTQTALATALGVAQPNVSKRLRGETAWPVSDIYKAASFLGVSIVDLLPTDDSSPRQAAAPGGGSLFVAADEAGGTPSRTRTANPLIKDLGTPPSEPAAAVLPFRRRPAAAATPATRDASVISIDFGRSA